MRHNREGYIFNQNNDRRADAAIKSGAVSTLGFIAIATSSSDHDIQDSTAMTSALSAAVFTGGALYKAGRKFSDYVTARREMAEQRGLEI